MLQQYHAVHIDLYYIIILFSNLLNLRLFPQVTSAEIMNLPAARSSNLSPRFSFRNEDLISSAASSASGR